ncbi:MAG: FAD-dependent monooxygenase [Hyphomicrobiales bacterium]|nr:FAD-dependent monooxygenase [Hyphomicrobiales bacterium]MBV8663830.1 FAD-dependent monooxygenase [Hyphomicrobiales bacterium]
MSKPILVVGAGPVGLTLAAELARYRVPVRIIDKAPARTDKSKALAVWARTLELLDRSGCAEAFLANGLEAESVGVYSGKDVIARVTLDEAVSRFRCLLMIPQSETERLLDEQFEKFGGRVERNTELTGFTENADGVACAISGPDGRSETVEASFLIGCDGAHSTVRRTLGMPFDGETLTTHFVLADVHVDGLAAPKAELAIFWNQDGIFVLFPISPGRYRLIADVGALAPAEPTLADVQAIVDRRGPGGVTLSQPVWISLFGINERKVRDYRAGRVFVAGDAAHIHSPAGGQGMNTGMQDAFNLAWKLALVTSGRAGLGLIDSYSAERSPVAEQILADSGRLLRVAMVRNTFAQNLRNFAARHILGLSAVQHALTERLSEITIGYPNSPLNAGSAGGLHGPAPGARIVADRPFGAGDAPRFALLAREDDHARAILRGHASILEPQLHQPPDERGIWLVRPDGYVAAVARADRAEIIDGALAAIAAGVNPG